MKASHKHISIINQINSTRLSVANFRLYVTKNGEKRFKPTLYKKGELYPLDVAFILIGIIASAVWNYFFFFFVFSKVNIATGSILATWVLITIAIIISIMISKSLADQAFENTKNHFLFLHFKRDPSAKKMIMDSFRYSSKWIAVPLLIGCFGATIFVYDMIKSDMQTTKQIDRRLYEIAGELANNEEREKVAIKMRVEDSKVLREFNKISIGAGKTSTDKAVEMDSIFAYHASVRDFLKVEKKDLRFQRQKANPVSMLSDLVEFFGRLTLAISIGCLLSLGTDVSNMRKIFCAFSVAYSRLWCYGLEYYINNTRKAEHLNRTKANTDDRNNSEHFEQIRTDLEHEPEQFEAGFTDELNDLPGDLRDVYRLLEEGKKKTEIAKLLGIGRTTVYERIDRIKAKGLLNGEME